MNVISVNGKAAVASFLLVLMVALLTLSACVGDEPRLKGDDYATLPYDHDVRIEKEMKTIERGVAYVVFYDARVSIPGDPEAEEYVNSYFSRWTEALLDAIDGTIGDFRADQFAFAEEVLMEAENEVTYLDGGLISMVCRLRYSCSGFDYTVCVGGACLDLGARRELGYGDIMKSDTVTVENILTSGFSGRFPMGYREEVQALGGSYAGNCGIFAENGSLVFFLKAPTMPVCERIFTVSIRAAGNGHMFYYDLTDK